MAHRIIYGYSNGNGYMTFQETLIREEQGRGALEIRINIPDELSPYTSIMDKTVIEYNGEKYLLDELLYSLNGKPVLRMGKKYIKLRPKEIGWVSTAMYL